MKKDGLEFLALCVLIGMTSANGLTVYTKIGFAMISLLLTIDIFVSLKRIFGKDKKNEN